MALSVGLRDDATFENFYPASNGLAQQATEGVAEGVGETYLYLWGEVGAGCSHLLQAACHRAAEHGRQSLYLPLEQLRDYGPELLEGLESLDLVCIDRVQEIAGDRLWEEALFHLYNRLRDAGTGLLVAADRAPRQLPIELADLASRLSWGMVFNLQVLDDDAKVAVLQARAHARGIDLSDEAALFILHRSPRQMNELFALLECLDEASLSAKRKVTIPFIKATLGW
nr:DnaA regulatory inactivator Hda [Motiliproteus sediminis]